MENKIRIEGAKQFNLKNINVDITNGTIDCSHLTSGMYNLAFQHKGIEQQITFIKK